MSTVKKILTVTTFDEVKEFTTSKEIFDYYKESTKYIIIVEDKWFTREPKDNNAYVHDYLHKITVRNSENEEVIIRYDNFKLKINNYFERKTYAGNTQNKGFKFEIIDNNGNSYDNIKIWSIIKDKSFKDDFSKDDLLLSKLQNIINFMVYIKSFNDLKEVEEVFSSYK